MDLLVISIAFKIRRAFMVIMCKYMEWFIWVLNNIEMVLLVVAFIYVVAHFTHRMYKKFSRA